MSLDAITFSRLSIQLLQMMRLFMEHRYIERAQVNERVELWNDKYLYGEFETENWCSGGVFIKGCQNIVGNFNSKLFMVKFCSNPNLSYIASHNAVLVHKNDKGIGFKWSLK
jgi:hypothetical protein